MSLNPFAWYGTVFLWDIPEHWCHVPGRGSNVGLEEWKHLTIPLEGEFEQNWSQCKMFDPIFGNETECQFGWEYGQTDYSSTIPSQFDWVCEREQDATECFTWFVLGAAIGTGIFGILADKYGRKTAFFLGRFLDFVFSITSLFFPQSFLIYKFLMILRGFATGVLFTVPQLLVAEVSGTEERAWIFAVLWMIWVFGNCLIPFVAMVCRDWFLLGWIYALPGLLVFVYYPFIYESPRWLISTGQEEKATEILLEIAKQNGTLLNGTKTKVQEMVKELGKSLRNKEANNCENQKEKVGVWDLLSNPRLAFHFWMLAIALSMSYLSYDVLTLNSTKMAGNRFLNYFYLSLVELPAGWVGGKLVEVTGRRWTQVGFFLVCISSCLLCAVAVAYPGSTVIVIIGALGVKFAVTVTSLVATIQATEIFPTPLRSTGNGLATTVSSVVGLFGPYMVYIGTIHPSLPYGILLICSAVGLASASLLPETLQQPLPETVTEANEFGKGQRFWSYLPTQKAKNSTSC